jgi:hypothetical protein
MAELFSCQTVEKQGKDVQKQQMNKMEKSTPKTRHFIPAIVKSKRFNTKILRSSHIYSLRCTTKVRAVKFSQAVDNKW